MLGLGVLSNLTMLTCAKQRGHLLRQWMAAVMATNFALAIVRVVLRSFYVPPDTYEWMTIAVLVTKAVLVLTVIGIVALERHLASREVSLRLEQAQQAQHAALQAAVEQRTAELRQALVAANDANHAKTDFLARISHDLRSPLTSINGYAQLLQRMGGRPGQLAQTIRHSAEHMQTMVNDLIDYARGDARDQQQARLVYVHGMLDDVASEGSALAARNNNRFEMRLPAELPPVLMLDAKRVRQMLMNLLENAAKFTHQGLVTLTVSATPLEDKKLELLLSVSDTGIGISKADQARMFDPFFRSTQSEGVQGIGLGLSIVQTWTQRMGGTIEVQSQLDRGSTFTVRLPVEVGQESDMASPQRIDDVLYLPSLEGCGRRIWVVEDNPDIRNLLNEELQSTGFEVITSPDGAHFIAQMQVPGTQPPCLVLTDFLMPGADGTAVLQAVRAHWPGVPVVLLSATQKTMQSLGTGRSQGFDAGLMKPLNLADLRITLAQTLHLELTSDLTDAHPGSQEEVNSPDHRANLAACESFCLQTQELERIEQWVDMGALTDLTEWAEDLARQRPECAAFANRILALLAAARLDEVRALCKAACHEGLHA